MEDEKTSGEEGSKYDLILKIGIPVVVLAWLGVSAVVYFLFQDGKALSPGNAGDMFGAVNALFSALAFAFLIYTALMQREELKLQREELRETRKELARSAEAHQELVKISSQSLEIGKKQYLRGVRPSLSYKGYRDGATPDAIKLIFRVHDHTLIFHNLKINEKEIDCFFESSITEPDHDLVISVKNQHQLILDGNCTLHMHFLDQSHNHYHQTIVKHGKYTTHSEPRTPYEAL
ncbi:MAG: hypothetical protein RIC80_09095 [Cyclobacteriaceae bacterium]